MQFDQGQVHHEDIQLKNTQTDDASKWAKNEWNDFAKGILYPYGLVDIGRGGVQYKNKDTAYQDQIIRRAFPVQDVNRAGITMNTHPQKISNDHLHQSYMDLGGDSMNKGSVYDHDSFMSGEGGRGSIIGRH